MGGGASFTLTFSTPAFAGEPATPIASVPVAPPSALEPACSVTVPPAADAVYAIVWRKAPGGAISAALVAETGDVVVDPGQVGIVVPTVAPGFPRGVEPEVWVQRGSIIVCLNVDQYKGCVTVQN